MNKPNIFKISTKELSQDGFFTWLILWAKPEYAQYDQKLHNTAQDFVRFLLDKPADFQIAKVNADRQWENIDIWAEINDDLFILIEDKTNTGKHSDQLSRYKETAKKYYKDKRQIICIYLKTGSESKSSLKKVKEQGYRIIDRKNLLDFFANYQVVNDIYTDFTDRIKSIEKSEKSYETLLIGKWCWDSWTGFYQFLDEKLDRTNWRYVSNPNGGFLGLWWNLLDWKDSYVYLQIEQGNLCFKIGEVEKNRSKARNEWYNIIMKQAEKEQKTEITKPQRFGNGTYMTVAIVERKNWLGADNEMLDKEKIIDKLKEYQTFLNRCVGENTLIRA